jgi:hypothetical protein
MEHISGSLKFRVMNSININTELQNQQKEKEKEKEQAKSTTQNAKHTRSFPPSCINPHPLLTLLAFSARPARPQNWPNDRLFLHRRHVLVIVVRQARVGIVEVLVIIVFLNLVPLPFWNFSCLPSFITCSADVEILVFVLAGSGSAGVGRYAEDYETINTTVQKLGSGSTDSETHLSGCFCWCCELFGHPRAGVPSLTSNKLVHR